MSIRLVLPVMNAEETLEKARPGLIYRTDLPYRMPNGSIGYRKGWVRPDDVKILNRAKKQGDAASVVGKYKYEADLFDEGEGEAWAEKAPKEKKPGKTAKKTQASLNETTLEGSDFPYAVMRGGKKIGTISRRVASSREKGITRIEYVARDSQYTILRVGATKEDAMASFGIQPKADAMVKQERLPEDESDGLIKKETPLTGRIPVPEPVQPEPEGKEQKSKPEAPAKDTVSGDVQADIEKPIAKMKFRDYGSWSASGKHISAKKRSEINQKIAEIINLPSDEIDAKELEMVRQYSGFGGVSAEDERGVLYDYYTSPPAARMVWRLLSKVATVKAGAKVLEPSCGTGVFFDVAPQGVDLIGVEYDARTATVAGLLQGDKAKIYQSSFEQFNLHNRERFDSVIGNAPFGDRSVQTSFLDEPGEKTLDRYFISRSLDTLKGGGSMALIVAPGVMDNVSNKEWRSKMLRKGQFVGAVRLPNQSFKHTGTGVSPDVVMFRAYPDDIRSKLETMTDEELQSFEFWDDSWVNGTYYDEMPGHRLGRVERGNFDSEVTVGKLDPEDMDHAFDVFQSRTLKTAEEFAKIRQLSFGNAASEESPAELLTENEAAAVAAKTLRVGMTKTMDGKVYRLNENHRWELVQASDGVANRLDRIKEISETVKAIRSAMQLDEPVDDLQRQARALIEAYEKDFGVSHADDKQVDRFIKENPALSGVYEALTTRLDSDVLTKNSIYEKAINIVDGHNPAIAALFTLQQNMKEATPETVEAYFPGKGKELIAAMWEDPDIFVDHRGVFLLREDFISGNAWEKIDALQAAIDKFTGPEYERNREQWMHGIEALRDAIGWLPIEEADISPQASWVPESLVNRWAKSEKHSPPDGYRYGKNEEGKWGLIALESMEGHYSWRTRRSEGAMEEGDWKETNDDLVYFLNNQKQRSKYTDTDIYNDNMKASFQTWIANDEEARREAEDLFNRHFNTELGVPTKTYPVHLDGWSNYREIKPWQWQSIHHLYRQGKGISALGTGYGKAQPLYAKILTPNGWKLMGDIVVGDMVIGANGMPTKVIGVYPQGEKDIFEVVFNDGSKTQTCAEHLWETKNALDRRYGRSGAIRSTDEIAKSIFGKGGRKNHNIPIVEPIQFEKKRYAIPPYTMGAMLGDGSFVNGVIKISNPDSEITQRVEDELPPGMRMSFYYSKNRCLDVGLVSDGKDSPYRSYLKSIGLYGSHSYDKFVPEEYKFGSIEDRIEFLRGIMDTDGYVSKCGMSVEYCTSSIQLADDVTFIVRSLGGLVRRRVKTPVFTYRGEKKKGALSYTLLLQLPPSINPFFLNRKALRVIPKTKYFPTRYITGVNPCGRALAQCIMVEDDRHLYVTDDLILTHNTEAAIALVALLRQEGKVTRPFFQVPNNKVKDWVRHFNEDMPGLKIGFVDPETKGYADQTTRFKWYQELASGNFDVIILPETAASEIQLNPQNDKSIVDSIAHQFAAPKADDKKSDKKKEKQIQSAEGQLSGGKYNKTITFEDFACDAVFCDEAHRLKNLFTSSLSRETGLNDGRRSDRALSFFKKCEHMRRGHDGKNVFLLTATPLTNSPLEYYNMMQHVSPEELKKLSISNIDDFIRNFADIEEGDGYDPFSGKLRKSKILTGFKNLRTLQDMFFKYTDLQNDPKKIGLKKPDAINKPNILPKQNDQVQEIQKITKEVEAFKAMSKEERESLHLNNFVFYNRMRTASLDLELYDPVRFKGWKNPKVEAMADSAAEIVKNRGGGQVIFCDRVLSSDGSLNMHDKIKKALVSRGFKESEIVIVNGVTKSGGKASDSALEAQVSDAIDGYNGKYDKESKKWVTPPKYKIIIGTTQTIGEGVNLQTNSSALHHMDIPYRPSDFIQRNGRIDRQGNQQSNVELHTYATAGTIDNYSMALVSGKENWINQLLNTKSNVFTNPDAEGASNMDEILMSLTEEWGDKAGAAEKKAAIEAKKAEAIKAENTKQASSFVKQLAIMRGALQAYKGEKSSRDYQNRVRKIENIEASLAKNPEFKNPEVLGKDAVPFIYHEGRGTLVKKGDLIISSGNLLVASDFDYKKRQIWTRQQVNNEYGPEIDAYDSDSGSSYEVFIPSPTPKDIEYYRTLLDEKSFYSQPLEFKKENYKEFLRVKPGATRVYRTSDGFTSSSWRSEGRKTVNVFDEKVRSEIVQALKDGKMDAREYAAIEKEFGSFGDGNESKDAFMKKFNEHPKAQAVVDYIKKRQSEVTDGWVDIFSIASAVTTTDWDIRNLLDAHPDIEVQDRQGYTKVYGRRGYQEKFGTKRYFRFKDAGIEKSMAGRTIVTKGGNEYVLYQRRG